MKLELIKITRDEKIEFILCVNSIKHFNVFYDDGKMLEFSGNSDIKTAKDYARIRQQFVKESHEPIDLEEN
jgi:1-deoxy-D-xylulose 5-phosphate reductoisomerase